MAFDKPHQLSGDPDASMVYKTDEMLEMLFQKVAELEAQQQGTGDDADANVDITRWLTGPWTLDSLVPTSNICVLRQDPAAGVTYNDYAPEGIDKAVALELEPGAGATITGIRQFQRQRRFLGIINRDSAENLTLAHENTGSTARYRFKLPSSTDIVLGPNEAAWMYYNIGAERWQLFITPHSSGGLSGGGTLVATADIAISEAAFEAANGTPIEMVAAPGAGIIAVPITLAIKTMPTVGYSSAPDWRLRWAGIATNIFPVIPTGATGTSNRYGVVSGNGLYVNQVTTGGENLALELSLSVAPGTPGTGVATAKARLWYVLWNLN